MSMSTCIRLLFLAAVICLTSTSAERGSCAKSSLCCNGRDSSCIITGRQFYGGYVSQPCYCDEGCLETGDCCHDYKQTCSAKVVDCAVSQWSIWSSCSTSCGKGVQRRSRLITTHPSPRGAPCGDLDQSRGCLGTRCSKKYWKYKNPIRETAGLLPAKFWRKRLRSGRRWDVRENLFRRAKSLSGDQNEVEDGYQADQPALSSGSEDYCIVFELSRVTKACKDDKDFIKMQKGRQMCALCPADAKRKSLGDRCQGHGVDSKLTRWRSTVKPRCHGKWRRIYEVGNCPCKAGPDFIFV